MFIPHKSRKSSAVVVVDIGSESIGAAIVDFSQALKKPRMVYSHREPIKHSKNEDPKLRLRSMREALLASTLELSNTGVKVLSSYERSLSIDRVFVVCGVPWSKTIVRFTHFKDEKPFAATKEYTARVMAESEKKATDADKE